MGLVDRDAVTVLVLYALDLVDPVDDGGLLEVVYVECHPRSGPVAGDGVARMVVGIAPFHLL
jgi:hypothetical protein